MEFLTEAQLEKYNRILDRINRNYEESRQLEDELEKENNKYVLNTLAKNSKVLHGLSHVNVKIFSDIIDLFTLYREDINNELKDYMGYSDCNFYLIEVHLSKDLLQKFRGLDWRINLSIKYDHVCICRTVNLTKKLPVYQIVPINKAVFQATVTTRLFLNIENECIQLMLEDVRTDISYHFTTQKIQPKTKTKSDKILQLINLYLKDTNINSESLRLPNVDYVIPFSLDISQFVAGFVKNCYHNVDVQVFTELENGHKSKIDFCILQKQEVCSVIFESNKIIIQSNYEDMALLKKYFTVAFPHTTCNFSKIAQEMLKIKSTKIESPQDVKELRLAVRSISQNITT